MFVFMTGQLSAQELYRGTDEQYMEKTPAYSQNTDFAQSLPGNDGSYPMPIVYAAMQDSDLLDEMPEAVRSDMMDLLTDYMLYSTKHNLPQTGLMDFLKQWGHSRQVDPEFK